MRWMTWRATSGRPCLLNAAAQQRVGLYLVQRQAVEAQAGTESKY